MKAIVHHDYGSPDVLELQEVDMPSVSDDEVFVRVRAAALNPGDWHFLRGEPYILRAESGLRKPKVKHLGLDLAGRVEAAGRNATQFEPGDEVFGAQRGAFAEYVSAKENALALKPANLTFEQAATLPVAGLTALQGLRDKGQLQPGQRVVVNGASGGVGTFTVQIAKALRAEVTGVCSTRNVDMVLSLGADDVIDYTKEDFTQSGERYDVLLDTVGRSLADCLRVLTRNGVLVLVGAPSGRWLAPAPRVLQSLALSPFVGQKLIPFLTSTNQEDLVALKELIEAGVVMPEAPMPTAFIAIG